MTNLELAVINNYYEWLEIDKRRKERLMLNNIQGALLLARWQREKKVDKETAKEQIGKLILNVVYNIGYNLIEEVEKDDDYVERRAKNNEKKKN